ncbi:hypothetical protein Taro_049340, partial [Colocasia esculenta]|nr:hypothetical protein [Colocasia esculenta]
LDPSFFGTGPTGSQFGPDLVSSDRAGNWPGPGSAGAHRPTRRPLALAPPRLKMLASAGGGAARALRCSPASSAVLASALLPAALPFARCCLRMEGNDGSLSRKPSSSHSFFSSPAVAAASTSGRSGRGRGGRGLESGARGDRQRGRGGGEDNRIDALGRLLQTLAILVVETLTEPLRLPPPQHLLGRRQPCDSEMAPPSPFLLLEELFVQVRIPFFTLSDMRALAGGAVWGGLRLVYGSPFHYLYISVLNE